MKQLYHAMLAHELQRAAINCAVGISLGTIVGITSWTGCSLTAIRIVGIFVSSLYQLTWVLLETLWKRPPGSISEESVTRLLESYALWWLVGATVVGTALKVTSKAAQIVLVCRLSHKRRVRVRCELHSFMEALYLSAVEQERRHGRFEVFVRITEHMWDRYIAERILDRIELEGNKERVQCNKIKFQLFPIEDLIEDIEEGNDNSE